MSAPKTRGVLAMVVGDPPQPFPPPGHEASKVDAPGFQVRVERQGLEGDCDLGHPALFVDARFTVPDPRPVPVHGGGVGVQGLGPDAVGVDLKNVAATALVERVQHHRELIVREQRCALNKLIGQDSIGLAVVQSDTHIQCVIVVEEIHAGLLAGRRVLVRVHLVEVRHHRGLRPDLVVQPTVQHRRPISSVHLHALVPGHARISSVGRRRRRGEQQQDQQAAQHQLRRCWN